MCPVIYKLYIQLLGAEKAEDFTAMLSSEDFEFHYQSGLPQPANRIKFSDKEKVVGDLSLHHSVFLSLAELEQMRHGPEIQKFSMLMSRHPIALRKAFVPPTQPTSDFIQDLFAPTFSPRGSNHREREEAILMAWLQYLRTIEGLYLQFTYCCSIIIIILLQERKGRHRV